MYMIPKSATVVITTKNRKDDLRRAIASSLSQTGSVEVLVLDDGSTDGTEQMVRTEFTSVNLHCFEESKGYIVRRNQAARLAAGEIIFSLDDDAEFSTSSIVEDTLREFESPMIGALAIPFIDVNRGPEIKQLAPDKNEIWINNEYIGTAHAVRKDLFLKLGGYREVLIHQGEEGDFCIRMMDAGCFVKLGCSEPILHHESPLRNLERINFFGQRNLLLFAVFNVPFPQVFVHLAATLIIGLKWGMKQKVFRYRLKGAVKGLGDSLKLRKHRAPVQFSTYFEYRKLKRNGPTRAGEIKIVH